MANLAMEGRRPVLLVDDAHRLTREMLEQLVELQRGGPLGLGAVTVVIAGDAPLSDLLTGPAMAPVRERIDMTCSIGALDASETGAYIEHRLAVVGWKRLPRFDADAFTEIHRASAGNPVRINALSHQVVLSRYLTSQVHVDAAAVEEAVVALQEAERQRHAQAVAAAATATPTSSATSGAVGSAESRCGGRRAPAHGDRADTRGCSPRCPRRLRRRRPA